MELLKFNDSPKSPRRGKNPAGFIGAGIMVAVMGLSSTLAGTIDLGSSRVEFGQGVIAAAACDQDMVIAPVSTYIPSAADNGTFRVSGVNITDIDFDSCDDLALELRAFNGTSALEWNTDSATAHYALVLYVPSSANNSVSSDTNWFRGYYTLDGNGAATGSRDDDLPSIAINTLTSAEGSIAIGNLRLPATANRITIESRKARTEENS